jgi:hypothetical protein
MVAAVCLIVSFIQLSLGVLTCGILSVFGKMYDVGMGINVFEAIVFYHGFHSFPLSSPTFSFNHAFSRGLSVRSSPFLSNSFSCNL